MTKIRGELDERLDRVRLELMTMNDLVTRRIDHVTTALLEGNIEQADEIIRNDDEIDLLSEQVEELCIETLMREQPVATDLRAIIAAIHMNADIERSGDLTSNIAKAVGYLVGSKPDDQIRDLVLRMGKQAELLFEKAGEAYRELDVELAIAIDGLDDVLDQLHQTFIESIISEARHGALSPNETLQLAMIGRFYERIGDHAENVAQQVRYIVDGWTPERAGAQRALAADRAQVAQGPAPNPGLAVIDKIAEARQLDATRRDFVTNVSHELKTPIAAIGLLAETLADTEPGESRQRLADHLDREVRRAEHIINDLLELSRLEGDPPKFAPAFVDDIVHEAVDVARGFADANNITLAVVGVPSGIELACERRQIVQAMVNLIDNAIRYSDPDSQVTITVDRVQDYVDLIVADEGTGIARTELDRIFERFYRVDRARSRETGGTGLGLSIVRHVADNHDGRVSVESTHGKGSTFSLQLPLRHDESK